jgi:YHS domain-containing protein
MTQVKDPVCGMMIEKDEAVSQSVHESTTYYFCSETCRRTFESDPDQYGFEKHEPPYTVSEKGITAPKFGSAGSGGLEHEPGPERHDRH